ncbi:MULTISPECIES: DUF485 domain-containing protein [unclassified Sphingomonas]|uniref:DUF485 domain-containing protein n=1 Tax=unclassified Sphingomonas TaxID=196159 RepID=UPI0006FD5695|nr:MULTISPECIES: DUF485 domain-containing protein [unclassified Sphingomonas]KQX22810.1 hypothetical protein ASD17_05940 [Sphingomonas sp. Root1294]KQY67710.1 hypothetical protein ASD39_07180 [Sphingomonas sp. Root50]KRB88652.1 hypothetical protein ASE22_19645 [Sphingomonas sp. Root720]
MAEQLSPEEAGPPADARLEAALRSQERLGWTISALAVLVTIAFMVAMTLDWPVLDRTLFGHAVSGFTVAALCLLALFIVGILLFSAVANRTDKLRGDSIPTDIGGDGR